MTQHTTGDDVMIAIASQHARITMLIDRLGSSRVEERPAALQALLAYLAGHEAVEEELIHPLMPRVGDHDLGLERVREEAGMGEQILRLEQLDVASESFKAQLRLLADSIKYHSRAEDHDELPRLARDLTSEQAALIVEALHAHESGTSQRSGSFDAMLTAARAEVRDLVGERRTARR